MDSFAATSIAARHDPAMIDSGLLLARQRRAELYDLIQADPKQALQTAVLPIRKAMLPPVIQAELETIISARGSLGVLAALPDPESESTGPRTWRTAEIGDRVFRAFVHGRRLADQTLPNAYLAGIAMDDVLAVSESPLRVLAAAEISARRSEYPAASKDAVCRVSGQPAATEVEPVVVEAGGEWITLCSPAHVEPLEAEFVSAERPRAASPQLAATASFTEGIKSVILIRVDFEDLAGDPFSDTRAASMVSELNNYYLEWSYGRAGFHLAGEGSDFTPTLRMPQAAADYGVNDPSRLRRDARAAARSAGYDLDAYNFDIICSGEVPGFKFRGLGYIGSPGAWLHDTASTGIAAHELGHNLGLPHANFWDTSGQSIIGSGTEVEYGDVFDTMGSASTSNRHFNARYKSLLNWIRPSELTNVTRSGLYQIEPQDDSRATRLRALRVTRSSTTNYWVEFRQQITNNRFLMNGAGLRWAGNSSQESLLLDTTPGTALGKEDSALAIGRTFSDMTRGVHITPLAIAESQPPRLEVMVQLGMFTNNQPPHVTLAAREVQTAAGANLPFEADAADPEGDALAFHWDFGDGTISSNAGRVEHRWSSVGEFLARCVVSDMKGGTASASTLVRVGSPNTFRITGRIMSATGPVADARVYASTARWVDSDSDGRYALVGLASGSYSLRVVHAKFSFALAGRVNPMQVGPSRSDVDFIAIAPQHLEVVTLVPAGSVWQFLDDGSDQRTAWRELNFDDSSWSEGPSPLGYGDDGERTPIRFGPNSSQKHVATYFRHRFVAGDLERISQIALGLRRDDGAVVYLNGLEVFRSNMPSSSILSSTLASSTVGGEDERSFFETLIDPSRLVMGTNVLAVEVHQSSRSSSDIVFDLRLDVTLTSKGSATTGPAISAARGGESIDLTWIDPDGMFVLQSGSALNSVAGWSLFPSAPTATNGLRTVRIPLSGTARFFRLISE